MGLVADPGEKSHQFLSNISNPDLAEWAFNVSVRTCHFFTEILPPGDFEYSIRFLTRQLREIPPNSGFKAC